VLLHRWRPIAGSSNGQHSFRTLFIWPFTFSCSHTLSTSSFTFRSNRRCA
jgi:hypothetical protein